MNLISSQTAETIPRTVKEIGNELVRQEYFQDTCQDVLLSRQLRSLDPDHFQLAAQCCATAPQTEGLQLLEMLSTLKRPDANTVRKQGTRRPKAEESSIIDLLKPPPKPEQPK